MDCNFKQKLFCANSILKFQQKLILTTNNEFIAITIYARDTKDTEHISCLALILGPVESISMVIDLQQ